jgi:hypothetical protein
MALREERGRSRRRARWAALVGLVFVYCLLQVKMTTRAAALGADISRLSDQVKKLEVDLEVAKSQVASRQIYGDLMAQGGKSGFGPGGRHRIIAVAEPTAAQSSDLTQQLKSDLSEGVRYLLPQALAREVLAGGRSRAQRP